MVLGLRGVCTGLRTFFSFESLISWSALYGGRGISFFKSWAQCGSQAYLLSEGIMLEYLEYSHAAVAAVTSSTVSSWYCGGFGRKTFNSTRGFVINTLFTILIYSALYRGHGTFILFLGT